MTATWSASVLTAGPCCRSRPIPSSTAWSRPACAASTRVRTSGSRSWTRCAARCSPCCWRRTATATPRWWRRGRPRFSEDLAWMLRDRDLHWLASQLPSWAARCASSDGSADDTTVALMISPTKAALRPAGPPTRRERCRLGGDDHPGRPARGSSCRPRFPTRMRPPAADGAGHAPAARPPGRARRPSSSSGTRPSRSGASVRIAASARPAAAGAADRPSCPGPTSAVDDDGARTARSHTASRAGRRGQHRAAHLTKCAPARLSAGRCR